MIAWPAYANRRTAGTALAEKLQDYKRKENTVVLGLPRGGIPVAYEVAKALELPLDVLVVRKLGFPGREELAIGAIAAGGTVVADPSFAGVVSPGRFDAIAARESAELLRREKAYRSGRKPIDVKGKTVIVVDDGLATGASMYAAVRALRKLDARKIVVAIPVASQDAVESLRLEADEVVAPLVPEAFYAVGAHYEDFSQTSDQEVCDLLATALAA
jgi:predicted phosphoribosyltransferase